MKKVLHEVADKDGNKSVHFTATGHMILFANEKAKNPSRGDPDIAREAGIDPILPSTWARKYGSYYLSWLEEFVESSAFSKQAEVLEAVGMIHATQGSYSFWKDMARKHGVIQDEVKQQNITINTDFSQILISDPVEARRRILLQARGVDIGPGPGVASAIGEGERASQGGGTSDVQARPLEIPLVLDTDGRPPEQGTPIPAVPKQNTSPSLNRVLGKRKVPPRT